LMGKMVELENNIDRQGFLRLSTIEPVTRLLGNVISESNAQLAQELGLTAAAGKSTTSDHWWYRLPLVKKLVQAIYNRLHVIVNA